jgi:hypothetical protein
MKCAHPTCKRGIGLVSHRRGWFGRRLYCSRACRSNYVAETNQVVDLLFAPAGGSAKPVLGAMMRVAALSRPFDPSSWSAARN